MKRLKALFTTTFLLFLCFSHCSFKEENDKELNYPSDITQYEFLRYSGGQEYFSPDKIVKLDNNWDILLSCLGGKTRKELKENGVDFSESQLMLMKAMGFLNFIKDSNTEKITTILPILGFSEKQSLIQKMKDVVSDIEPELRDDIKVFKEALEEEGYGDYLFSILFSAVVDGIIWFPLRAQGFVKEFKLSLDRPLYDGVFWAYYPKRNFRCGTNIALGKDVYVVLNWSDGPMKKVQKIFNWDNLYSLRDEFLKFGKVVNEDLKSELKSYEVLDDSGNFIVPIIEMKADDRIFLNCQSIATKLLGQIIQKFPLEDLVEEYGFSDKEKAFVVTYHEWMWEFMEYLDERGIVKKPFAFTNPDEAEPKDIGKLLFIVKGSINK